MKKFIATVLLSLLSTIVVAKPLAEIRFPNGGFITLLTENERCKVVHEKARDATYTYPDGKVINACWADTPQGVLFKDEEGDDGLFPHEMVVLLKGA